MLNQFKNTNPNISSESPCKISYCIVYTVPDLECAILLSVIIIFDKAILTMEFPSKTFFPKKRWDWPFKWAQQKASEMLFTYVVVCIFAGLCNLFWKLPTPPPPTPQGGRGEGMWRALIDLQSSTWEASQSTLTIADPSTTQKEPQFSSINDRYKLTTYTERKN